MQNQRLDILAIEKLQRLIKSRYGKSLVIRQLTELQQAHAMKDYQMQGEDLYIPLRLKEDYLGTAVVPEASDLNQEVRSQLCQVVKMVMEPTLYSWYLDRRESNLKQMSEFSFTSENLEEFEDGFSSDFEGIDSFEDDSDETKSSLISNFLHLSGTQESLNRKVAFQIHEMAHRWAFVSIEDLSSAIVGVEDLTKLGALTLYIPKIENLDPALQKVLIEFMEIPQSEDHPLIVTSSSLTRSQLETEESILEPLKREFLISHFEVDKAPLGYQKLKEVLELFFFEGGMEN